jgi:hypothetical protein
LEDHTKTVPAKELVGVAAVGLSVGPHRGKSIWQTKILRSAIRTSAITRASFFQYCENFLPGKTDRLKMFSGMWFARNLTE